MLKKWLGSTGISRVFKEAAEYGLKEPELKVFGTSIRINLFRKPFKTNPFGVVHPLKNDAEISGWFGGAEAPPFYIRSSDMRGAGL